MDFTKSEGYVPKKKRREQDKDGKLATATLATEILEIPCGIEVPILPDSLEAWTKKTQICATAAPHAVKKTEQIEHLKQRVNKKQPKKQKK